MFALLDMSPIALVISMIMFFRRPPIEAAIGGAILAVVLWLSGMTVPVTALIGSAIAADTAVLFASTAFVIAPGLLFVVLIERIGVNQALSDWVKGLGWGPSARIVFVVLGLAPLLEAMTGFGVSLIATVPLLFALLERRVALKVAMTGMAIMPWGTLGLATVVGAALAHLDASALGAMSAFTSAPVFAMMVLIALWVSGQRTLLALGFGLAFAALFVLILYLFNHYVGPEIAGVGAAASITIFGLLAAKLSSQTSIAWPKAAWPYAALLTIIVGLKTINAMTGLDTAFIVKGVEVSWKPFASPGIALLIVDAILLVYANSDQVISKFLSRAKRPLLTIMFFLLMSQTLVKAGFLDQAKELLSTLAPTALAPLIAAFGGIAGYLTGSNVGGNAIVMPSIAHLTLPAHALDVLAAVQNSAAGHAALGSLPIVAIILGLAKAERQEEQELVRFGCLLAVLNAVAVGLMGMLLANYLAH